MNKRLAFAALAVLFALPLHADFDSLVRAVSRTGLQRVSIPFFGLVRFAIWTVHPKGVYDLELATFKGQGRDIDQGTFEQLMRQNADAGYQPLVHVQSHRRGELVVIWARPASGNRLELLLLTYDRHDDTVVLHTVVDVEQVAREVRDPHTAIRIARR